MNQNPSFVLGAFKTWADFLRKPFSTYRMTVTKPPTLLSMKRFASFLSLTVVLHPDWRRGWYRLLLRCGRRALLRVAQTNPNHSSVFDEEGFTCAAGWIVTGALGQLCLSHGLLTGNVWGTFSFNFLVRSPNMMHHKRVLTKANSSM
jgi:hypothetical protein